MVPFKIRIISEHPDRAPVPVLDFMIDTISGEFEIHYNERDKEMLSLFHRLIGEQMFKEENEEKNEKPAYLPLVTSNFSTDREVNTKQNPDHYKNDDPTYDTINVIEAWKLGFHLGNAVKYISRAGKKPSESSGDDIKKAIWYLNRYTQTQC